MSFDLVMFALDKSAWERSASTRFEFDTLELERFAPTRFVLDNFEPVIYEPVKLQPGHWLVVLKFWRSASLNPNPLSIAKKNRIAGRMTTIAAFFSIRYILIIAEQTEITSPCVSQTHLGQYHLKQSILCKIGNAGLQESKFVHLHQFFFRRLVIICRVFLNPRCECVHEVLEESSGCLACDCAIRIKELSSAPDVGLRLLHRRDIQEDK